MIINNGSKLREYSFITQESEKKCPYCDEKNIKWKSEEILKEKTIKLTTKLILLV